MIIFLSVGVIDQLADTLKEEYREDTPVAVVYKASWEDQKIVIGNLTNIAEKVRKQDLQRQLSPLWEISLGMNMNYPNYMIKPLHMNSGKQRNKNGHSDNQYQS